MEDIGLAIPPLTLAHTSNSLFPKIMNIVIFIRSLFSLYIAMFIWILCIVKPRRHSVVQEGKRSQVFTSPYKDFQLAFIFLPPSSTPYFQGTSCLNPWAFWDSEVQISLLHDFIHCRDSMLPNQLLQVSPLLSIYVYIILLSLLSFPLLSLSYGFKMF